MDSGLKTELSLKQRSILAVFETLTEKEKDDLLPLILLESDIFVYDFSKKSNTSRAENTPRYLKFSAKLIAQLSRWSEEGFVVRKSLIDVCYHIYKMVIEQSCASAIGQLNPPKYYFYNDPKMISQTNFCDIIPIKEDEREYWFERTVDINYHNIVLYGEVDGCWKYISLLYLFNIVEKDPKKVEDILSSMGYLPGFEEK